MNSSSPKIQQDAWSILQEPAITVNQTSSYMLLLSALDSGWEIAEPVHLLFGNLPDYQWVFYFNLRHPSSELTCQLIVEESPELLRYIYEERLGIVI